MTRTPHPTRRRSGAVLILVIVLLVLLAVMGITYMATARTDRAGAAQNIGNTQAEILVSGLLNLAQSSLIADLFSESHDYRAAKAQAWAASTNRYAHLDHPGAESDRHLASRVPVRLAELASEHHPGVLYEAGAVVVDSTAVGGEVYYLRTSRGGGALGGGGWVPIEYPTSPPTPVPGSAPVWPWISGLGPQFQFASPEYPGPGLHSTRFLAIPTWLTIGGRNHPAMMVWPGSGGFRVFLGADADGDGIADSLLFPIPGASSQGITYYGAIRVVDHNSAFNASLAVGPEDPTSPGDYFPTALALPPLLRSAADRNGLWAHIGGAGWASQTPPLAHNAMTHAEQLWLRLGRVLPTYDAVALSGFTAFAPMDMTALAYRGVLARPMESPAGATLIEQVLFDSLLNNSRMAPYSPDQVDVWFNQNFDFDGAAPPLLRGVLVTRNGVLNAAPVRSTVPEGVRAPADESSVGAVMQQYDGVSLRASVNTAGFAELWRQYWNVMVESPVTGLPPLSDYRTTGTYDGSEITLTNTPIKQFREMARWPRGVQVVNGMVTPVPNINIPPAHRVLLRAALAAVNTIDLRDEDHDITAVTFSYHNPVEADPKTVYEYRVYGNEPQPFITEVLFRRALPNDLMPDYIGIELFNPTEVTLDMTGWRLAYLDRTQADANDRALPLQLVLVDNQPSLGTLGPGQFLVIQNRQEDEVIDPDAPPGARIIEASGLFDAVGRELVLIRPLSASFTGAPATAAATVGGRNVTIITNADDYAPIDQFDMTEWTDALNELAPFEGRWFHYQRATTNWEFVFPGRYSVYRPGRVDPGGLPDTDREVQLPGDPDFLIQPDAPWRYEGIPAQGLANVPANASLGLPQTTATSSPRFSIPLNARGHLGPLDRYPYGGFARDGDILHVPYIGAYRFRVHPGSSMPDMPTLAAHEFWELNSITMDAAMADDLDEANGAAPDNNQVESVGRFVPRFDPATNQWTDDTGWATDLFDYLGVTAPQTDHVPEVPPGGAMAREALPNLGPLPTNDAEFVAGYLARNNGEVLNANASAAWREGWRLAEREGRVPIEGLVNLNTAPWRVLAALPLLPPDVAGNDSNGNGVPDNIEALAKAIVKFRTQNGPYRTLFDLNRIPSYPADATMPVASPAFQTALVELGVTTPTEAHGNFTPDTVPGDFKDQHLMMTRISNMVTTRSDWYTVYVLVQGWRGLDPTLGLNQQRAALELVAERRAALVVDRTRVLSRTNQSLSVMSVPQD